MEVGSMAYFLRREEIVVRAIEYMSRIETQHAFFRRILKPPTFPVVAEAHLGLAQADCVLALAHTVEFLEF